MTLDRCISIIKKHLIIITAFPVLIAGLAFLIFGSKYKYYESETLIYTGIATGYSIESIEGNSLDFFSTRAKFDNFLNIIKSRSSIEETALILYAQGLSLKVANDTYISSKNFDKLHKETPEYIKQLVVQNRLQKEQQEQVHLTIPPLSEELRSNISLDIIPIGVDSSSFRQTIENLWHYYSANDTNYLYNLFSNEDHILYSFSSISKVQLARLSNSDMLKLSYKSSDPGICYQTLKILTNVFVDEYYGIRIDQTNSVVKYFQQQVALANDRLVFLEDSLLKFQQKNGIINYQEQTKYIASQKEQLEVELQKEKIKLVSSRAAIQEVENSISSKDSIFQKSQSLKDEREILRMLNEKLIYSQIAPNADNLSKDNLSEKVRRQEQKIKGLIDQLFLYKHSNQGLPISNLLQKWIDNIILEAKSKANLLVLYDREKDFRLKYQKFAPIGAKLKGILRVIGVAEESYKEILHGLNLAKLKERNLSMSTNLDIIDPPFFPLKLKDSRALIIAILGFNLGILIILSIIFILEFFDRTLVIKKRALARTRIKSISEQPDFLAARFKKLKDKNRFKRLIFSSLLRKLKLINDNSKQPLIVLFFSTQMKSGKSFTINNLITEIIDRGQNFCYLEKDTFEQIFLQTGDILRKKLENINSFGVNDIKNILSTNGINFVELDYIFLEIPSIGQYPFSDENISEFDIACLIVDAPKIWTKYDQDAFEEISTLFSSKIHLVLNSVPDYILEETFTQFEKK